MDLGDGNVRRTGVNTLRNGEYEQITDLTCCVDCHCSAVVTEWWQSGGSPRVVAETEWWQRQSGGKVLAEW